jgi:hypothetical protein
MITQAAREEFCRYGMRIILVLRMCTWGILNEDRPYEDADEHAGSGEDEMPKQLCSLLHALSPNAASQGSQESKRRHDRIAHQRSQSMRHIMRL